MPKVPLGSLGEYSDRILRTREIRDYDGAVNGLQVENNGSVTRICATVDATLSTIRLAVKAHADLLIVHHGLFWSATHPWTGKRHEMLRLLLENNLAIYSSHLPLDAHPKLGNNAILCVQLGLKNLKPFFTCEGQSIGFRSNVRIFRDDLLHRLRKAVGGDVKMIPGGQKICQRIGVVTGGAGTKLKQAADEGVDTFITGEGAHWAYALAEELGLNVFYAGHYATETFGVKALAVHLSTKFKVPWSFIDHPTGL
jgi:dinuclear metal center YbgI/SA1388 family protein